MGALPLFLVAAACMLILRGIVAPAGSEQTGFVSGRSLRSTEVSQAMREQEGSAPVASMISAASIAAVPGMAEAATEQELNRFGFVFALVFLGFFVAGMARLLSVGKLRCFYFEGSGCEASCRIAANMRF